jgi:hypothetical protein
MEIHLYQEHISVMLLRQIIFPCSHQKKINVINAVVMEQVTLLIKIGINTLRTKIEVGKRRKWTKKRHFQEN